MQEFRTEVTEEYHKFLRMSPVLFDELLGLIESEIQKETTQLRDPISAKAKLAATFKFLSSGMNYSELQHSALCTTNQNVLVPQLNNSNCNSISSLKNDEFEHVQKIFSMIIEK